MNKDATAAGEIKNINNRWKDIKETKETYHDLPVKFTG